MSHWKSRHTFADFPDSGHVGLKVGDTMSMPCFDQNVPLQSPVAARYKTKVYKFIDAEWYVKGNGTRAVRVATELLANWIAMDTVAADHFAPSIYTGDEGFYGRASRPVAARVITGVFDTLHRSAVLQKVFRVNESGFRSSATAEWQFGGF